VPAIALASGIGLGGLFILGARYAPAVFLGSLLIIVSVSVIKSNWSKSS